MAPLGLLDLRVYLQVRYDLGYSISRIATELGWDRQVQAALTRSGCGR